MKALGVCGVLNSEGGTTFCQGFQNIIYVFKEDVYKSNFLFLVGALF